MKEDTLITLKPLKNDVKINDVCDAKYHSHRTLHSSTSATKCVFRLIFEILLLIIMIVVVVSFFLSTNFSSFFDDVNDDSVRVKNESKSVINERSDQLFMTNFDKLNATSLCYSLFLTNDKPHKSAVCLISRPSTFFEAFDLCLSYNMTLLKITNNKLQEIIFNKSAEIFGTEGGSSIWINGKWSEEKKKWMTYDDKISLDVSVPIEVEDFCLKIACPIGHKFDFSSFPCDRKFYFYCELL